MELNPGMARSLSDEELIRTLRQSSCTLTDTPAETELLHRFEQSCRYAATGAMAEHYELEAEDIETLANAMYGDAGYTAELLGILGEHNLTQPQRLRDLLTAVHHLTTLTP